MDLNSNILVTGATGMVGSYLVQIMKEKGYKNIFAPSRSIMNCYIESSVNDYFSENDIDYVIHLAAVVGGVQYNIDYAANILRHNIYITMNVLKAALSYDVKKVLYAGTCCAYPLDAPKPTKEEHILSGPPEPTNESYALAKIVGQKYCDYIREEHKKDFIYAIPANIYGKISDESLHKNHVISALVKKIHVAKQRGDNYIEVWGDGSPRREFVYVDDVCEAILHMMDNFSEKGGMNIGSGEVISISELTEMIMDVVGYNGSVKYLTDKPKGAPNKCVDSSKINESGWSAKTKIREGIEKAYKGYIND